MKRSTALFLFLLLLTATFGTVRPVKAAGEVSPTPVSLADGIRWQITGPFGGTVRAMAQDPTKPERMFLGTADGQMYVTTDAARNWKWLPSFNRPGFIVTDLIIDPINTDTLYAGVWVFNDDKRGGILKSVDGGETWAEVMKDQSVRALTMAPGNASVLVAGTLTGVYRSIDAAKTWSRISPPENDEIRNVESVAIDPRNTETIYAGTWHLPWKTTDGGKTWFSVKGDQTKIIDDSDIFSITVDAFNPDRVYCSACSGIYRSLDNGGNWTKFKGIPFSARRTHIIYQNPTRENEIFAGTTEGLWRTTDGGENWTQVISKETTINDIKIHPTAPGRVIIGADNSGVLISEDGGTTFKPFNSGFVTRQVSSIITDPLQRGRIFVSTLFNGAEGGVYLSEDNGRTWKPASAGLGSSDVYMITAAPGNSRRLYVGTNNGVYYSDNAAATWKRAEIAKKGAPPKKPGVKRASLTVDRSTEITAEPAAAQSRQSAKKAPAVPQGKPNRKPAPKKPVVRQDIKSHVVELAATDTGMVFAATWDGLFRTDDVTRGWERLNLGTYRGRVFSVTVSPRDPATVYAGTSEGLQASRDGGETWTKVEIPIRTNLKDLTCIQEIAVNPRNPQMIIAGSRRTAYLTRDGGTSWERIGRGIGYGDITAIRFNPRDDSEILVGESQEGALYISTDGARTFQRIDRSSSLPSHRMWAVAFDLFNSDNIYAGSVTSGFLIGTLPRGAAVAGGGQ
jgi:photosystem II stability/assembly factor-like uncharacterized protein